jgi:FAD:protein FMN transferase
MTGLAPSIGIDVDVVRRSTDTVGSWRAMGSGVEVIVSGTDEISSSAVRHARDRIAELEQLWSRFIGTSEISQLNAARGTRVAVSPETRRLVELMQEGFRATNGAFDPTMIVPIVRLGYADSFDGSGLVTEVGADLEQRGDVCRADIGRDGHSDWIELPVGTALDPGGIGKGLAADIVVAEILDRYGRGSLVSVGGDVSVGGPGPEGEGWRVVVLDPTSDHSISEVRLAQGGVATSSTKLRHFSDPTSSRANHHLIDPTTLVPLSNGVDGATVIAGTAAWAEILTKALMVGGHDEASRLDSLSIAALTVDVDGIHRNHSWASYEEK